ncbi:alpha-galactosidase [Microterricola viridarii]|uniref:Alpha-galactosidase n=1 Tax=Microterricola viridarii TaxID=412690 RepID=A0A0Y0P6U4_9MICO|nr:alpha-galactosidase [Microterricola viridarii]AMB59919.1 alpha-galactosidase [Microterricola viridarii]
MATPPSLGVALRAAGTAIVLDLSDGQLPAVVHWGADCGALTAGGFVALRDAGILPVAPSEPDAPVRVSLLPEHGAGWFGRPGVSGSRAGRAWSPRWRTAGLALDGVALTVVPDSVPDSAPDTAPADRVVTHGAGVLVVTAEDPAAELALELTIELTAAGVVRARAVIENRGAEVYQLDELLLCLPTPASATEVLDFAGRWGKERAPQRHEMTVGSHRREGRHGRTGLDSAMILHAGTPGFGFAGGEVWGIHAAWSGNHVHQVERVLSGVQLLGGGELLLPGEVRLAWGENYQSPWVYGIYGDGLDEAARRMHRELRARPQHPASERPVTLNTWEAVYFDHDLDTLLELADVAAEVGIERFVLDDGWFGGRRNDEAGLGDWFVSPEAWPNGLHPLIDHVRGLGMQFGLWFEPEMVNVDSELARAHPEWIMATGDALPIEARHQQALNLGIPECYAHVRDAMCAVLDEYDIAYIKWDHNRDLVDAATRADGRPGVHAQTLAFYRLVAELKARYPGLEIESCSSGGGRIDLGALANTDRVWVSDNNDPLERQQINRWTGQLVPPEMMGAHIAASGPSHTTGRIHSLPFRALTALFGHLGVEWDLRQAGAEEKAELAEWIGLHKELRGLLHHGDVVRLDHPDAAIAVHGVVAHDRSAAVYSLASVAASAVSNPGRIRFTGLDPEALYSVEPLPIGTTLHHLFPAPWWEDAPLELSGAALGRVGLAAPLMRPEQGVLFRVTRVG